MYQLLALVAGLATAVMLFINGNLSQQYGVFVSAVIIHIVGALFAFLLCALKKDKRPVLGHTPKWIYLGGAIGVLTVVFNNGAFGHISVTSIVALGLLGQIITSLAIDGLGLFGMEKCPLQKSAYIGLILSLVGVVIMLDYSVVEAVLAVVFSFAAGVTVVVSRTVNARLANKIGALRGSLINHLVGLPITIAVAVVVLAAAPPAAPAAFSPKVWIYLGGTLGVLVVLLSNQLVPKIAAFRLTTLIFVSQIFASVLIDLLGGNAALDASFVGGLIVAAGIGINMILERAAASKGKAKKEDAERL